VSDNAITTSPAAAGSAADPVADELLQSIVDVARAIFGGAASSIMLHDEAAGELVFRSVSGAGERTLIGRRFPGSAGIAGWVMASGEPMIVDDLTRNTIFDRDFAESTQYTPNALMAAPLVNGDRVLGVLEVLDPVPQSRSSLDELELLALFARQAAIAVQVVTARPLPGGGRRPGTALPLAPEDQQAAVAVLAGLQQLLGPILP
jgi:GAF domain-containing protein